MTALAVDVRAPCLYATVVRHVRTAPIRNDFSYRSQQWLVDLDDLPRRFLARDHLGDPRRSIRSNVDTFLRNRGVELAGGRVLMLANARRLGYVFNPLTVYWCFHANGELMCVLAEVHNTYGERHCYLLRTDERGRAETAKEFHVSPFNAVDGRYQMSFPLPDDKLALTVTLHRDGQPPFVATVRGARRSGTTVPWVTIAVTLQIHWQGVRLWLRRLPIVRRPTHERQEDVR